MGLTVGEVAKLSGVTVRTLHHYDAIGLVAPSGRSEGNYRLYERPDLERLQHVLHYKELDLGLDEIARLVNRKGIDRRMLLAEQRTKLRERAARAMSLVAAVDRALVALDKGLTMKDRDLFEAFGDHDPGQHAAEAERNWGATPEYKESMRRTKRYSKADWVRLGAESAAIEQELAMLAATGHEPTDPDCLRVAEKHRLHIDRYFYPCPHAMHVNLGEMYVADARFTAHYEKTRPGLAMFLRDAIVANAANPYVFEVAREPVKVVQNVVRKAPRNR